MKTTLKIVLCVFLIFSIGTKAQNTTNKIKIHKVWITMVDGSKIKGNLYAADTSGIRIMKNKSGDILNVTTINAVDIVVIKIRRKGKVGNSILIGGMTGVGASVLIGATTNDTFFTKGEVMAISSIVFVPLGVGIGALAGTKKENFIIGGNLSVYQSVLNEIQSYSIQTNGGIETVN